MIDYDQFAAEYARHRQVHPRVLKGLINSGNISRASSVLEIGCGTGNYILAIHRATGCQGWGVEPSAQMIHQARRRSETICFVEGKAEAPGLPDDRFDLIYTVDVIHHVEDRQQHLREAWRMLRPGGKLCTVTDSGWIIRRRKPLASYFPETVQVDLKRYPSISGLRKMMASAGFEHIHGKTVSFPYELESAQAFRDQVFSCLRLIPVESFRKGLDRMEEDLRLGPIPSISRYFMLWGVKPLQ